VASFAQYNDARDAVDRLARQNFPVDELEIVGSDLRTVERVTGKMTTERAALSGAAAGATASSPKPVPPSYRLLRAVRFVPDLCNRLGDELSSVLVQVAS
jgi:hypothetical protein